MRSLKRNTRRFRKSLNRKRRRTRKQRQRGGANTPEIQERQLQSLSLPTIFNPATFNLKELVFERIFTPLASLVFSKLSASLVEHRTTIDAFNATRNKLGTKK